MKETFEEEFCNDCRHLSTDLCGKKTGQWFRCGKAEFCSVFKKGRVKPVEEIQTREGI